VRDRAAIRRRRTVLVCLLAGLLLVALLAAGAIRGVGGTVDRAAKPFDDLTSWIGDSVSAEGKLGKTRDERDTARWQLAQSAALANQNRRLSALADFDANYGINQYAPVTGRVIGTDPTFTSQRVVVDVGAAKGAKADQPVVNASGLVGKVEEARPGSSIVQLVTNADLNVGVSVRRPNSQSEVVNGIATATVGHPNDIVAAYLSNKRPVRDGDVVVTAGTLSNSSKLSSPYPAGIPFGTVTSVENAGSDQQLIHIRPYVSVRNLFEVQVLTKPHGG
jgi:rod shape-determining protein MreC